MKYCPKCGAECEDNASFCAICGNKLPASGYRPNSAFNNNGENSTSYNAPEEHHTETTTDNTRTFGILSLIFAILGLNILGIIFGFVGLKKNSDSGSKSLCYVGIVLAIIHLSVRIIMYILYLSGVTGSYYFWW